jgi:hypothetical protein
VTRDELLSLFEAMSSTLAHRGCEVSPFVVEPPASLEEIAQLERSLDLTLPTSFRSTLLSLSRAVDWSWRTDEDFPEPFSDIFSGELCWSVGTIEQENELHRGWVTECFPDPDDPYDSIWHGKLAFFSVGNGDQLAVELNGPLRGSVVYLSHDDGEGHGYVLGLRPRRFVGRLGRPVDAARVSRRRGLAMAPLRSLGRGSDRPDVS